jgi:hypothetical protein
VPERTTIVLLAALAALCLPSAGQAAEVTRSGTGDLLVAAAPGEVNRMRVADDGTGFVRIRDEVLLRETINACTPVTSFDVRCAVATGQAIVLRQGDRDDRADIATTVRIGIDAQDGNDTFAGGLAPGGSTTLFRGGAGKDTASYADATAGVTVSLDGVPDDGRNIDSDDVADAETIVGSRFGDDLAGTPAAETFRPGQGDDVVRGDGGADRYESLATADGADRIVGSRQGDIVLYTQRTRGINATVSAGGADDGEPGERDELIDVAGVRSGSGADTLSLLQTVDAELDGGAGTDTLTTGGGDDVIVGGAGVDTVSSGAGVDRVVASDADRDRIDCGGDAPDEALVASTGVEGSIAGCEQVIPVRPPLSNTRPGSSVGVLRLSPSTLDVAAGAVAHLRLHWTQPRRWRDLRRIEVRLVRGGAAIARVALDPRRRRVRAGGGAARVVPGATRLVRRGRRVDARLALRLYRALTGPPLRVEVAAVDVRGRRQVERAAGALRVLP